MSVVSIKTKIQMFSNYTKIGMNSAGTRQIKNELNVILSKIIPNKLVV